MVFLCLPAGIVPCFVFWVFHYRLRAKELLKNQNTALQTVTWNNIFRILLKRHRGGNCILWHLTAKVALCLEQNSFLNVQGEPSCLISGAAAEIASHRKRRDPCLKDNYRQEAIMLEKDRKTGKGV